MDESNFWHIVNTARDAAGTDTEARIDTLRSALEELPLSSVQSFQRMYEQILLRANRWDLWGAAYLMNEGCSDDCFRYFRDWLISEGKDVFERALQNPDSLVEAPALDYYELESFGYVALEVFESKGGGELERDFACELAQPAGDEWEEDDLPEMFPRLAARFGPLL